MAISSDILARKALAHSMLQELLSASDLKPDELDRLETRVDVGGEHSNLNSPWGNAHDAAEYELDKRARQPVEPLQHQPISTAKEMTMETVDSTSDQRTVNNVMRHAYRVLSDAEKAQMQAIKDKGPELHDLIESIGQSRELSVAKTKTEEAVMWAVKHLTR